MRVRQCEQGSGSPKECATGRDCKRVKESAIDRARERECERVILRKGV